MTTEPTHVYRFADTRLVSSREIRELVPDHGDRGDDEPGTPDRTSIVWSDVLAPIDPDWYHRWGDDREEWARFGAFEGGWVVRFPALAEFRISTDASVIAVWSPSGVPDFTVRHLLLNQVLPLALSRRRRVVLHAGAVAIDGVVTAFIGPTGSGKSTLVAACARAGAEVMCDDSLVLDRVADRWLGVPSYPALRLWESALTRVGWAAGERAAHYTDKHRVGPDEGRWAFAEGPRPVSQLILLDDDGPRRPAAVALFSQLFRLDIRDQAEAVRLFREVGDLAAATTIRRLGPRESRDAMAVAARLCGESGVAGYS